MCTEVFNLKISLVEESEKGQCAQDKLEMAEKRADELAEQVIISSLERLCIVALFHP
jgi:hypothetical protein